MDKQKMINLLKDCAEEIFDREYNTWDRTNTCMSFEEWRSERTKELISSCHVTINELEDLSSDSFDPTSDCEKTHCECEAPELCKATKSCMGV